jgi:hypothetical protein
MIGRLGRLLALLLAGTAMLIAAYALINTTFMLYDDEGYVLLTYRNFINGGRLYDDIFSQYGPWPYAYHLVIDRLSPWPLTHSVGRALTAIHWTLTALLVGAVTVRLTRQKLYALPAAFACFGLLWPMSSEPSHPGSLICLVLALGTLLVVSAHDRGRWSMLAAGIGVIAALLVLTKINIGVLFLAGAGAAALRLTAWPTRWQATAGATATLGLLAVPWGLMGGNLHHAWVLTLAVLFTLCVAGWLWLTPATATGRPIPPRTWFISALAFGLTLLVVVAAVCARGTTPAALLQAVLLQPLRHPSSFIMGFTWQDGVWPVATLGALLTARAGWEWRRQGRLSQPVFWLVGTVRTACFAWFVIHPEVWLTRPGLNGFVGYCLPLLPLFLIPLKASTTGEATATSALRLWGTALALPQVLHAYPVAGSQLSWGTFLLVPLFVTGWHEATVALADRWPARARWLPLAARTLLLVVGLAQIGMLLQTAWARHITSKPFGLPGAETIRAGDRARLTLRVLTLNASVHADVLFSRQGMYSYNLWSGVPTPTAQNATHWFWLLDAPAQQAIIDRLRTTPRSAVITSQALDAFLVEIGVPMACPLQTYILEKYRPLFVTEGMHFLVPHGARAVPFGRVEFFQAAPDAGAPAPFLLQTNLALNSPLASVQLADIHHPWPVHETYTPANARLVLQPINAAGDITGPAITLPRPEPLRGLFRLNIYLDRAPDLSRPSQIQLTGLDADGRTVSESAF